MRKILLTTDLSGAAANAADFAVYLANKTGAELHLLYCYKTKYEDHIQRKMDELDPEKMLYGEITDFRDAASFLLRRYSADLRMRVKSSLHEHIVDGSFQDIVFDFIENEQVDLVVMASESGVLPIPESKIIQKWRLQPGKMFLIDLDAGRIIDDKELKDTYANAKPYKQWIKSVRIKLGELAAGPQENRRPLPLLDRQQMFGYTQEDLKFLMK